MSNALKKKKEKQLKKKILYFQIDCGTPLQDGVFLLSEFSDFLKANIKVNGKKGNLGTAVVITEDKSKINV